MRERGLSFEQALDFNFHTAVIRADERKNYGEVRYAATGFLGPRLHVLCYCETENGLRIISFRKANDREKKKYEKETSAAN